VNLTGNVGGDIDLLRYTSQGFIPQRMKAGNYINRRTGSPEKNTSLHKDPDPPAGGQDDLGVFQLIRIYLKRPSPYPRGRQMGSKKVLTKHKAKAPSDG
jgi:hypothetical protein